MTRAPGTSHPGTDTVEGRLRFLAEATEALAASLDFEETVANVGKLLVPSLADWCVVDELTDEGALARVGVAAAAAWKQEVLEEVRRRYPPTWDSPQLAARVVRASESIVLEKMSPDVLAGAVRDEDHLALVRRLEPRSALVVPLVTHGQPIGAVTLAFSESGRRYGPDEVELAEQVARRAALALDRARIHRREQRARLAAEEAQEQVTFLARVTELLSGSLDYVRMLRRVADLAVPRLADWCIVYVLDDEGAIKRLAVAHGDEEVRAAVAERLDRLELDPDADEGVPWVIRTGKPELVAEATFEQLAADVRDPDRFQELIGPYQGATSWMCVPLLAHGRTLGALAFMVSDPDRRYDAEDVALAQEVARRAALAIDQARVYRLEQQARLEAEAATEGLTFLAEASGVLASSLDYEATLERLARLAVPTLADGCVVDVLGEGREIRQLAIAHVDPEREAILRELEERYPTSEDEPRSPVGRALREGRPVLLADLDERIEKVARDAEHAEGLRRLGVVAALIVPLVARGQTFGAITFLSSRSDRRFDDADRALVEQLAARAAIAVDNARLYRQAAERAQAARALATVGDGVLLVDAEGVVRLWNPGAEAITGLRAPHVVGRPAAEAIPGWADIVRQLPVAGTARTPGARAHAVPLELGGRELWLSFSGVGFGEGTVFTFRDLTEERRLEEHRAEFVATASHELRTPLAAVYGAAMTLRRDDIELGDEARETLLGVIVDESDRLARIVNDILWASRVDSAEMELDLTPFDPRGTARRVLESAQAHARAGIEVELVAPEELPHVLADEPKLVQVLTNLVDNAIKYSPDGGRVELRLAARDARLELTVSDDGLGIPRGERDRIFEKFYRLDPNLTRGVGGTGLGLYICRALVERMGGRIVVESEEGVGSAFTVELPVADERAPRQTEAGTAS